MASGSSSDKPLPQPPSTKDVTRLSIEGRAHLRRFIKYALSEENVDGAQDWAAGIELALKELCASLARGAWLSGLKAARKVAKERRIALEKERTRRVKDAEKAELIKRMEVRSKAKDKAVNLNDHSKETTPSPPPQKDLTSEERRRVALRQISTAISTPSMPSPKPLPAHLLLVLSPKSAAIVSPSDQDLDVVPSNKLCTFSPDKFFLPSEDDLIHVSGSTVIYGLDEWDGE